MNKENPKIELFAKFLKEFQDESDRGAVILAAAMLDQKLKTILQDFLIENSGSKYLFKGATAPLGSLCSRQNLAFSLGLISEYEFKDCEIVRKIRNDFAHKFELEFSFQDRKIYDLCWNLQASTPGDKEKFKDNPRFLFINSVIMLYLHWMYREEYVKKLRLTQREWKY
jgi:mannitol operon repressor